MRFRTILLAALLVVLFIPSAWAGSVFYANTNELGYAGTVWNITDSTGPWTTSSPRNANIFTVQGAPHYSGEYNILLSSWWEHPQSNVNDSFLQLYDSGQSITTAQAGWSAGDTVFSMSVTGANAPYPYSRFWQPDQGMAWGVTFLDYTYTLTATFDTAATRDANNFLVSTGSLLSLAGNFSGSFQSTADVNKNPITNGDIYGFDIDYSRVMFDTNISGTPLSEFGVAVPLPSAALAGFALLGAAFAFRIRRRRRA